MAFSKEVLDEILKDYHGPDDFYGPSGIMKQLTKALVERTMEASNQRFALTGHLGYQKHDQGEKPITNRRNGKNTKELRTDHGPMEIEVPRDREGTFEPRIVPKHQRDFKGFDDKILSMYALGLTTRQIQDHLKDMYAVDVSPELISRVTDEVKDLAAEWRSRALEPFYPVLFLDALRVNIKRGTFAPRGSVEVPGRRRGGQKVGVFGLGDTFRRSKRAGMWIEQNEGASDFSPRSGWVL